MANTIRSGRRLVDALKAEGFPLPDYVREARLIMTAQHAIVVQYDLFIGSDDLARLGRALVRLADDDDAPRLPPGDPDAD